MKAYYTNHIRQTRLDDLLKINLGLLYSKRFLNKNFWDWYNFLEKAEYWSDTEIRNYQIDNLKRIVKIAYENTTYFRQILDSHGIKPSMIQDFEDFKKLPYSDRHLFMNERESLINKSFNLENYKLVKTSGTTGNPLVFYKPNEFFDYEMATIYQFWKRIGFNPTDKRVVINGDSLPDNKPWIYSWSNYLRLSPDKINTQRVKLYLELIKKYGAQFLHGYPSSISLIAKVIVENNIIVPFNLKGVFLASEPIYNWQRETIEKVFNCRVFSHYGNTEGVGLAGECEHSSQYHFSPFFSYVEIEESTGEIIGTSFFNDANPLIRHKTNDIAKRVSDSKSCLCGRSGLRIENVEGRQGDFLVSFNGEYIFPQTVTWILYGIETIKETKIHQKRDLTISFKYTPYSNIDRNQLNEDIGHIRKRLAEMMKGQVGIDFEESESIPRATSGKLRWIESEISDGLIEKGL